MYQWIDANKVTPPNDTPILFVTLDGDIELGVYTRIEGLTCEIDKEHNYPWCDTYQNIRYKQEFVTYWSRIPKPPK